MHATLDAARVMLNAIAANPVTRNHVEFKASGDIRTVQDAMVYEVLAQQVLGAEALNTKRFRIGASSLLSDIEAVLNPSAVVVRPNAGSGY